MKKNAPMLLDTAGLLRLVEWNDAAAVKAVRRYFDQAIAGHDVTRPGWQHLRAALLQENLPMMRLLVTWGAHPDQHDLQELMAERGTRAAGDIYRLRCAGLQLAELDKMAPVAQFATAATPPAPAYAIDKIPAEWRAVLKALQNAGAPEAMIGGGALRDLYNGRPVKDVDIFLCDRFMNKRMIKKAFAAAGLTIKEQLVSTGYGAIGQKFVPKEMPALDTTRQVSVKRQVESYWNSYDAPWHTVTEERHTSGAEAWTVCAGPDNTEYNIVFVKGELGKALKAQQASGAAPAHVMTMIGMFDIGLCQIGFDGRRVHTTPAYEKDAATRSLTIVRANRTTREHLRRIVKKYDDFALCAEGMSIAGHLLRVNRKAAAKEKKLQKNKQPAKETSSYSWSGYAWPNDGYSRRYKPRRGYGW